jgi:hypothetical protein
LTVLSGFADVSLWQLVLVAGVALFAAIIGGLAGNGTGALMPLVLVPLIGAIALPGAFLAKTFVECMPVHIHAAILDAAVITGGVVMISAALRQLV